MPRRKSTPYLTKEEMEKLPTPRLLAYQRSLLELPEWRCSTYYWPDAAEWHKEYQRALDESKELLDNREHVD